MSTLPVGVSKCERLFRRLEVGAQPRSARAVHSLHPSDTAACQRGLRVMCDVPQSCPGRCSGRPACELLGGWPSSLLASMAKAWKLEERSHGKHAISFGILAGSHRGSPPASRTSSRSEGELEPTMPCTLTRLTALASVRHHCNQRHSIAPNARTRWRGGLEVRAMHGLSRLNTCIAGASCHVRAARSRQIPWGRLLATL